MKVFFLFLLLFIATGPATRAQACRQVEIAVTPVQKKVLREYITQCRRGRYFVEDKGLVKLVAYQNAAGQQVWQLVALIDDRYQANPATAYSLFGNDVILVYQADSLGNISERPAPDKQAANAILTPIVASRTYRQPLITESFVDVPKADGGTRKVPTRTVIGGNYWNSQKILFYPDGTYKVLIGV
ncbi:hypothetical protein CDA63_10680 [Hymenobacter amundsenii]|uniref:Uncharacterized protein n=1 Tax=Hymenobacter amundsenii TaxID=2006685 RepID=A0A246FKS6_9BACT|nr:hypothetical protein [Hymenobacter amundsenii]OWP63151.1 hypothetical protein CDA63_10680 [Hymenobacter amundsenii]